MRKPFQRMLRSLFIFITIIIFGMLITTFFNNKLWVAIILCVVYHAMLLFFLKSEGTTLGDADYKKSMLEANKVGKKYNKNQGYIDYAIGAIFMYIVTLAIVIIIDRGLSSMDSGTAKLPLSFDGLLYAALVFFNMPFASISMEIPKWIIAIVSTVFFILYPLVVGFFYSKAEKRKNDLDLTIERAQLMARKKTERKLK